MTKKHYELIAEIIAETLKKNDIDAHTALSVFEQLADRLESESNRFDKTKFISFCRKIYSTI